MAPRAVVTCARGSSDHAATFAKYLVETRTGLLASSAAPSISSVYASKADLEGVLFIAISQSGASPDLLAAAGVGQGRRCARGRARQRGGLSACAHRPSHRSAARRRRNQCRGHQVVHRIARGDRASGRALDAGRRTHWRLEQAPDQLVARLAARLGRRDRAPSFGRQSLRRRSRTRARYRAGGRAQAQGDLRAARRGVQRRGGAPRSDGARAQRAFRSSPSRSMTRPGKASKRWHAS